jgi:hypothetical protein
MNKTAHKIKIVRDPSGDRQWRAECDCGWHSDWVNTRTATASRHVAQLEANDHMWGDRR